MEGAIQRFLEAARRHGASTLAGDSKAANVAYESLVDAIRHLRATPDKGVELLTGQLSDEDLSIVTWSALFLLPFDEPKASAALGKVARSGVPRLAFNARMTLKEWKAGRLTIE